MWGAHYVYTACRKLPLTFIVCSLLVVTLNNHILSLLLRWRAFFYFGIKKVRFGNEAIIVGRNIIRFKFDLIVAHNEGLVGLCAIVRLRLGLLFRAADC